MPTYIGFLRAVNVGGRKVPMAELRSHVEQAGFTEVATYIQSGNLRVASTLRSAAKVESRLEQVVSDAFGFEVPTIVRSPGQLKALVAADPKSPLGKDAQHYVAFLRDVPSQTASTALTDWDVEGERLTLDGRDLHLWLTKPSHQAKATNARIEKIAGTVATSRGWKVVRALADTWA